MYLAVQVLIARRQTSLLAVVMELIGPVNKADC